MTSQRKGKVYLVGAGPGDVGLITVKAVRCLQKADVVLYDFHVNSQLLAYTKRHAELIYCGKQGRFHEISQDDINKMMAEKAASGKSVCRLKAGDPFVFGRGGEEAAFFFQAGVEFEVVPGVTSASAVPAYAGIPLTHRHAASSFAVLTGSKASCASAGHIDYSALMAGDQTLVFLMGVKNLEPICAGLISHGKERDTPAALIQWGTRAEQKTVSGTLETLPHLARERGIGAPSVLIIGKVVELRPSLRWYEQKPLFARRILITGELTEAYDRLEDLGAELFWFPTLHPTAPEDYSKLDAAVDNLEHYDWIIFPSHYSSDYFFERLFLKGHDTRSLKGLRLCAIGDRTVQTLNRMGLRPEMTLSYFNSQVFLNQLLPFHASGLEGLSFLLPGEETDNHPAANNIRKSGGRVDQPAAYRLLPSNKPGRLLKRYLREDLIACAIFESPEGFTNLLRLLGPPEISALARIVIAALDPPTKTAAEKAGLQVAIVPEDVTIGALVEAVASAQTHLPAQ